MRLRVAGSNTVAQGAKIKREKKTVPSKVVERVCVDACMHVFEQWLVRTRPESLKKIWRERGWGGRHTFEMGTRSHHTGKEER